LEACGRLFAYHILDVLDVCDVFSVVYYIQDVDVFKRIFPYRISSSFVIIQCYIQDVTTVVGTGAAHNMALVFTPLNITKPMYSITLSNFRQLCSSRGGLSYLLFMSAIMIPQLKGVGG
jgi:hypothetical protein